MTGGSGREKRVKGGSEDSETAEGGQKRRRTDEEGGSSVESFNKWEKAEFGGNASKKNKFMRLMGAGKAKPDAEADFKSPPVMAKADSSLSAVDEAAASARNQELEKQFDQSARGPRSKRGLDGVNADTHSMRGREASGSHAFFSEDGSEEKGKAGDEDDSPLAGFVRGS